MVKMKKGFWKKTGCILVSASIILTGWTFMGSSISEADYNSGTYNTDGGTISDGTLDKHVSELRYVNSTGNLIVDDYALDNYEAIETVYVEGDLSVGEYAFSGDSELRSVICTTMSDVSANSFYGCTKVKFAISSNSGGCYTDDKGALYKGTTLVYVPASVGSTYTVKSGTTAIAEGAFNNSVVKTLYFYNGDADAIEEGNFGSQTGWPKSGTVCYAYGSTATSAAEVTKFFTTGCENAGSVYIYYQESESDDDVTTYTVTVTEVAADSGFESKTITYSNQKAGTIISPTARSGYTCNETYTVTTSSNQTVTFTYTVSSSDDDTTNYPVTVTEEFYDNAGTTLVSSNASTLSGSYAAGTVITPVAYDGYTVFGTDSYTVTSDSSQTIAFKYKANGGGSSSTTTYTVTVYDEFYKGDLNHMTSSKIRSVNKYTAGSTYSFSHATYSGYSAYGGRDQSGTVTGNMSAYFFYLENGSSSSSTTTNTTTNETNSSLKNIYQITAGANQTVTANGGPVSITCNGELNKLTGIFLNQKRVDGSRYTLASGSTVLTFTDGFMKLFKKGDYVVRFEYTDGYAETGLKVVDSKTTTTVTYKVSSDGSISAGHTKDATPKTADGFDNRYLLCMAFFLLGAGAILFSKQKRLEAILAGERDEE